MPRLHETTTAVEIDAYQLQGDCNELMDSDGSGDVISSLALHSFSIAVDEILPQ